MRDPAKVGGSIPGTTLQLIISPSRRMPNSPANIHDLFFKRVMSDPESAGQFLREHLPPGIAALLSEDPPELQPGSFVDAELMEHQTDLLFQMRLREGGKFLTYILVEHKSAPDRLARLQLLRYVTQVLAQWHRENKRLPLPPVVPLLAHHGPSGWSFSPDFMDLYGPVADPLRPYLVTFRHALVDLARIDDSALSQHLRLRAFLKALKYILRGDLAEHLESLLDDAKRASLMDLALVVSYIEDSRVRVDREVLRAAMQRSVSERKDPSMNIIFQKWLSGELSDKKFELIVDVFFRPELYEHLLKDGGAKGAYLVQVLQSRFGPLPNEYRGRLLSSNPQLIEAWLARATEAPDLPSVFE